MVNQQWLLGNSSWRSPPISRVANHEQVVAVLARNHYTDRVMGLRLASLRLSPPPCFTPTKDGRLRRPTSDQTRSPTPAAAV